MYQEQGDLILTFPGAYHGGFSPNYNICEAVNMASAECIEHAKKHIQMNSREGFPRKSCFSLEWMILESTRNIERLHFSQAGRSKLLAHYKEMVDQEIDRRKSVRYRIDKEVLFQGKKIKFFELQCSICRYYCYLSCIGCDSCQTITCLTCSHQCGCSAGKKLLLVRHTENELVNY